MGTMAHRFLCLEISENTLRRLLDADQVCAAELKCLDCASKDCLRRLCLESCVLGRKAPDDAAPCESAGAEFSGSRKRGSGRKPVGANILAYADSIGSRDKRGLA